MADDERYEELEWTRVEELERRIADDEVTLAHRCGDCAYFERCQWLLQRLPDDIECDWEPTRWRPSTGRAA